MNPPASGSLTGHRPQIDQPHRLEPRRPHLVALPNPLRLGRQLLLQRVQATVPVALVGLQLLQFIGRKQRELRGLFLLPLLRVQDALLLALQDGAQLESQLVVEIQ